MGFAEVAFKKQNFHAREADREGRFENIYERNNIQNWSWPTKLRIEALN